MLLLLVGGLTIPRSAARAQAAGTALPLVESFEALPGGLPAGWSNDSSGELSVALGADTRKPREGKTSWRIRVPAWDAGEARVKRGGIPLRSSTAYALEVWLRGEGLSRPVTLALRR